MILLVAVLATFQLAQALTSIEGPVSGLVELLVSNSPYLFAEDVVVEASGTLQIKEGVTVYVGAGKELLVLGRLVIEGSAVTPVLFTADVTDQDQNTRNDTAWAGIHIAAEDASIEISGLVVEYAGRKETENRTLDVPALRIEAPNDVILR